VVTDFVSSHLSALLAACGCFSAHNRGRRVSLLVVKNLNVWVLNLLMIGAEDVGRYFGSSENLAPVTKVGVDGCVLCEGAAKCFQKVSKLRPLNSGMNKIGFNRPSGHRDHSWLEKSPSQCPITIPRRPVTANCTAHSDRVWICSTFNITTPFASGHFDLDLPVHQ
jgi:hypothetical protein